MATIRTVLGDIDPAGVGTVLPHEHLYCDLRPLEGREAVRDSPAPWRRARRPS